MQSKTKEIQRFPFILPKTLHKDSNGTYVGFILNFSHSNIENTDRHSLRKEPICGNNDKQANHKTQEKKRILVWH